MPDSDRIDLQPGFSFAQFRRVTPVNEASLFDHILDRNAECITVKRRHIATENLTRIFNATFKLSNAKGFRAMNLRDLCRESGLSMGGLYGYLQSKDQLSAMIEDVIRYLCEMLPVWFCEVADPLDRFEAVLRGHIYLSEMLHPWFLFVFMEARSLPAAQKREAKNSEQCIQAHLAELLAQDGRLCAMDGQLLAGHAMDGQLLAGHALALAQDWHLKRWKYRAAKQQVDAFADSVMALVRARVAAGSVDL